MGQSGKRSPVQMLLNMTSFLRRKNPVFSPKLPRFFGNYDLWATGRLFSFAISPSENHGGRTFGDPIPRITRILLLPGKAYLKYARIGPGFPFSGSAPSQETTLTARFWFAWKIHLIWARFAVIRPLSMPNNGSPCPCSGGYFSHIQSPLRPMDRPKERG
jgi:hypothetical protein